MTYRKLSTLTSVAVTLGLGASALPAQASDPFLVKDINPSGGSAPAALQEFNGELFFSADDGTSRRELWKSDGTAAGTVMVKDINPVPGTASDCCISHAGVGCDDPSCQAAVCGQATECCGASWAESHCADLASEVCGTLCARGSSPDRLTDVNGQLFFTADDSVGSNNRELWISDGTQGATIMVKEINVSGSGSDCCVAHATPGCDDPNSCEVFVCFAFPFCCSAGSVWDDVCAGLAAQVCPICELGSSADALTNANGTLFFRADDGINGLELWISDGTQAGTMLVKDINPGAGGQSVFGELTNVNGTVFFSASDGGATGTELWKSDGTAAGTQMVKEIAAGPLSSSPAFLTDVNGTLFFSALNGADNFIALWKSDGTAAGTVLVKDFNPGPPSGMDPRSLANVNGTLFFQATDGVSGSELWRSDGTDAGTFMVKDINPGAGSSGPSQLTNMNGILFFRAADSNNNTELWKSDGTEAGTVLVKDIHSAGASFPHELTVVNGTLYFAANDGANGEELWISDGTTAGTVMAADINPGIGRSEPSSLTNVDGTLFFSADDGSNGFELWALQVGPVMGACCFGNGFCTPQTQANCEFIEGQVYLGDGTECVGDFTCPAVCWSCVCTDGVIDSGQSAIGCVAEETACNDFCQAHGGLQSFQCDLGPCTSIPTVSQWGMILMTLLVLTAGTLVLFRARAQWIISVGAVEDSADIHPRVCDVIADRHKKKGRK